MPTHVTDELSRRHRPLSGKPNKGTKRAVIRLQLNGPAKKHLDNLCNQRGMTQIAVLSKTLTWLVAQDEIVLAHVLGLLSQDVLGEAAHAMLKRIAAGGAVEAARGGINGH
jgi:hypothetical protein